MAASDHACLPPGFAPAAPGLRNAAVPVPPSLHADAAASSVKYVTPLWARGAAVAVAAECGSELLHAALDASYTGFDLY